MSEQTIIKANVGVSGKTLPPLENKDEIKEKFIATDTQIEKTELVEEVIADDEALARAKIAAYMSLPPAQRTAKLALVLDRGVVYDRLKVDMPEDLYGEWARNDPLQIDAMRAKGFWVDTKYATKRSIHSDGSSANIVGDVIHMVTTKENKNMIEAVKLEMQLRSARHPKQMAEEDEFRAQTESSTGGIIPTFTESKSRSITNTELASISKKSNV